MTGTADMMANMLGLGPMMQQIQDPAFLAHVQSIVAAIAATNARTERMEELLCALIARLDYDRSLAAPLVTLGAIGAGTHTASSGAADNGIGGDPPPAGGLGNGAGTARTDRHHARRGTP
jgi:hypothetical protein